MKDILYFNSVEDIRLLDTLRISNKEKELPNLIILTILSAGAGEVTPIFLKSNSDVNFTSIYDIGTKFILDGKEITSDDFLLIEGKVSYFGLLFEDSNEHTLKVSLVDSTINQNTFESNEYLTKVTIGTSITSIGDFAFSECSRLTSVTIPNSVTSIGKGAFSGCSGLTGALIIPKSVTTIVDGAFRGCTSLTSVAIPNSVTEIDGEAFQGCTGLTSVTIGNSVTSIGQNAFSGCSGLTSMVVESGNSKYDSRNNCNAIIETATNTLISGCKNTIIPNSVTSIGERAFYRCTGLTSINIPNSVTTIGSWAFEGCSGLASITSLATTAPTISNDTFYNVKSGGTLHVPSGSNYSTWMSTNNYYLGKYNWTKVEDA